MTQEELYNFQLVVEKPIKPNWLYKMGCYVALTKEQKQSVLTGFQRGRSDTGSPEVQVALLSERIKTLTEHFKAHVKDHHSRYGLIKMVNKRRRHLDYLKKYSPERYQEILSKLNLRK